MSLSPFGYGVLCGVAGTLALLAAGTLLLVLADRFARRNAQNLEPPPSGRGVTP